jgi:phage terminase large subunit-like protein
MNLKELQADPAAFRRALLIDCDGQPKRLGNCLDDWQDRDFAVLDEGWKRVAGQGTDGPVRGYLERPRGHSKTLDLAVMATWALFASRRQLKGYGAAADQDQARLLRDAIAALVRLNPWLGQILRADKLKITNERTGSALEILTSDAPTSYGLTPDFVIADELVHWRQRELWDSLISSAAKRAACMVVVISNAGFGESWQWTTRELVRQDPAWYFSRLDGPVASWITEDRLAEQRRLLPRIAYDRLWLNRWSSGSGDALDPGDIDRAVTLSGPIREAYRGWCFFAGLDLGLSRDKAALAVVGRHIGWSEEVVTDPKKKLSVATRAMFDLGMVELREEEAEPDAIVHEGTGRLRLADLRVWSPPAKGKVNIEAIEDAIADLDQRFRLTIGADPWQAAYLIERLKKRGLRIEAVDFTGNNLKSMCSAMLEAFAEGRIELYQEPPLISDLRALRVEEKSYGCRLVSPRGPNGHGDAATALSIALHLAKKMGFLGFTCFRESGKLIAY